MNSIVIIMVNYNGFTDTIECIESIKFCNTDCDIIVVDNNSTNNEIQRIKKIYPEIISIKNEKNIGFSGANNVGIEYALKKEYEYIIIINNDTVIDSHMIDILVSKTSEKNITVPSMYFYDSPNELWYGGGEINNRTGNCKHMRYKEEKEVSFSTGCCFCANRNVFEKMGLFDDRYFMYCEDIDFSIRLLEEGYTILYCPEAKLWHKVGKTAGKDDSFFSIYYNTRNRLNCIKEHRSFFYRSAYYYSLVSRLIRLFQHLAKKKETWKAYYIGILDHKKGLWGRCI